MWHIEYCLCAFGVWLYLDLTNDWFLLISFVQIVWSVLSIDSQTGRRIPIGKNTATASKIRTSTDDTAVQTEGSKQESHAVSVRKSPKDLFAQERSTNALKNDFDASV